MRLLAVAVLCLFSLSAQAQKFSLPKAVAEQAYEKAECDNELDEKNKDLEFAGDLGGGLKLIELSCWSAAYNFGSIFFAANPADLSKARLLQFRIPDEKNRIVQTFQLSNPSYDEKKQTLESFHKGRGVGDCGTSGNWRWDGKEFVLSRFWSKNECDGEPFFDDLTPLGKYLVYPPKPTSQKKK